MTRDRCRQHQRRGRCVGVLLLCIGLAACSSHILVETPTAFPEPLIEPLPFRLGVYFPDEFTHYVYTQPVKRSVSQKKKKQKEKSSFTVNIGAAQTELMKTVFGSLFKSVTVVEADAVNKPSSEYDLLLVPEVLEFQFSTPKLTKVNVYEIWIKYQFSVSSADAEEITEWVMPVYGKTPTRFMKSKDKAVALATLVALRDCGAAFITGFSQVPEIRSWMAKDLATHTAAARAVNRAVEK